MGRPEKPIDWEAVDDYLMSGCLGTEVAEHFHMHPDTFYRRVQEQFSMGFTDYCSLKRSQGDSLIRHAQFKKALEKDNTMLIWLGKNRLGQREHEETSHIPPLQKQITSDHENMLLKNELVGLKERLKNLESNAQ